MTTQQTERDALRKLAVDANPEVHGYTGEWFTANALHLNFGLSIENAKYVAAANPAKVIELLDAMDAQDQQIAELDKQVFALTGEVANKADYAARMYRMHQEVSAELDALREQEPAWWHAECADPDYSGFHQSEGDAFTEVSDHGGYYYALYTKQGAVVAPAQPQDVNAELVDALERIADTKNYGEDGIWNAESYPDEIARTALAKAAQQKGQS